MPFAKGPADQGSLVDRLGAVRGRLYTLLGIPHRYNGLSLGASI